MNEELRARLALLIAAFGRPDVLFKTVEQFGSATDALQADSLAARLREGAASRATPDKIDHQLAIVERAGARWVLPTDPDWPTPIRDSALLCMRGEWRKDTSVAVVGPRAADRYGVSVADALGQALAESRLTVVSGAARGVDQAAHRAALEANGRTIAVLGTGVCGDKNAEKAALMDRIAGQGAVISEYLADAHGSSWSFTPRNRLIARLSKAVVVVQAAMNSGALNTARHARNYGIPTFAVPGDVTYPLSQGTNKLIADGHARILAHPRDLADATGHMSLRRAAWPRGIRGAAPTVLPGLGLQAEPGARVLEAIEKSGRMRIDQLDNLLGIGPKLPEILLDLELKGQVRMGAGDRYELTA